jgi:hypothetical protein
MDQNIQHLMVEGYVKCVVAKQTKSNSAPLPNLLNLGKRVIYGCNALGTAIPPYFVFVGKKMRSELLEGATPGVSGTVSETGWSNSTVFRKYLKEQYQIAEFSYF